MKNKLNFNLKTFLIDSAYFIIGAILYSTAIYSFARNANFAPGGISGLALIVNHISGLPIGISSLLLNIPLALFSFRIIGLPFFVKSLYTMLINMLFIDFVFPHLPTYNGDRLLAALFTGVVLGIGLVFVYMRGSSTGGSDFFVLSIRKLKPHFSVGQISLVFDAFVILLGGFVYGDIEAVLYGIIASFGTNVSIDFLLGGASKKKLAIVITDKGQQIADAIGAEVDRGSTLVGAKGAYTGNEKDMLYCVCSKTEIYKVRSIALMIDPGSILMISDTSEVLGEGFETSKVPGSELPHEQKKKE